MRRFSQYALALSPALVVVGGGQFGRWMFDRFHCTAIGKQIETCYANGVNIQGLLGLTLFWCQLAAVPAVMATFFATGYVICDQIAKRN